MKALKMTALVVVLPMFALGYAVGVLAWGAVSGFNYAVTHMTRLVTK